MVLAAGFQAAYGDYTGTNRVGLTATVRHILTGQDTLDSRWLRLAKEIIRQLDRPIDLHMPGEDTEATA
jgi:hypothetical protein